MKKFVAFVVKQDKAILNTLTVLFLVPMAVLAVIDMDNIAAVFGLLVGYVVMVTALLSTVAADIRRESRKRLEFINSCSLARPESV